MGQNGIPVANAVSNVAMNADDLVVAVGSSFVKPSTLLHLDPRMEIDYINLCSQGRPYDAGCVIRRCQDDGGVRP
jgi:hypothetical protein